MEPLERIYLERITDGRQASSLAAAQAVGRPALEQALAENQAFALLAQMRIPLPQRERILSGAYGIAEYSSDTLEGRKMLWTGLLFSKRSWYVKLAVVVLVAAVVAGLVLLPGVKLWHAPGASAEPAGVAFAAQLDEAITSQTGVPGAYDAQQDARDIEQKLRGVLALTPEDIAKEKEGLQQDIESLDEQIEKLRHLQDLAWRKLAGEKLEIKDLDEVQTYEMLQRMDGKQDWSDRRVLQAVVAVMNDGMQRARDRQVELQQQITALDDYQAPEVSNEVVLTADGTYMIRLVVHDCSKTMASRVSSLFTGGMRFSPLALNGSTLLVEERQDDASHDVEFRIEDIGKQYKLVDGLKGMVFYSTAVSGDYRPQYIVVAGHLVRFDQDGHVIGVNPEPPEFESAENKARKENASGGFTLDTPTDTKVLQQYVEGLYQQDPAAKRPAGSTGGAVQAAVQGPSFYMTGGIDPSLSEENSKILSQLFKSHGLIKAAKRGWRGMFDAMPQAYVKSTYDRVEFRIGKTSCDFGKPAVCGNKYELEQEGDEYISVTYTGVCDVELAAVRKYIREHYNGNQDAGYIAFGKDGVLEVYYLDNGKIERHVELRANADGTVAERVLD